MLEAEAVHRNNESGGGGGRGREGEGGNEKYKHRLNVHQLIKIIYISQIVTQAYLKVIQLLITEQIIIISITNLREREREREREMHALLYCAL